MSRRKQSQEIYFLIIIDLILTYLIEFVIHYIQNKYIKKHRKKCYEESSLHLSIIIC